MKYLLSICSIIALMGCSYSVKQSETVDQKIARFKPNAGSINEVPEITTLNFTIEKNVGRKPASISSEPKESVSIKRLYFTTLFEQYLALSKFSSNHAVQLKHCPSFHTSFVNLKATPHILAPKIPDSFNAPWPSVSEEAWALYPELSLPVTVDNIYPKVGDIIPKLKRPEEKRAMIQQGIDIHIQKNYQELNELCQTGSSSNYYSFENLVTFMNNSPKIQNDTEALKLLFKTTVFTNALVLKSLNNFDYQLERSPSSIPSSTGFIEHTKMEWVNGYFDTLKTKRYPKH